MDPLLLCDSFWIKHFIWELEWQVRASLRYAL